MKNICVLEMHEQPVFIWLSTEMDTFILSVCTRRCEPLNKATDGGGAYVLIYQNLLRCWMMWSMVGLKREFIASGLILSIPWDDHLTKSTL